MGQKNIKLYWCRGKGRSDPAQQNFGDYLSPLIVEMVSGRKVEYCGAKSADLLALGTIMSRTKKAKRMQFLPRKLHVWGCGTGSVGEQYPGRHHYHLVRGPLTKAQVDGEVAPAFGDPGLLAAEFVGRAGKKYSIGIVPHYVDAAHPFVSELAKIDNSLVINVFWSPVEVIKAIASCDYIVSSSMHGLIVADSLGIPNRRVVLSTGIVSDYKFDDYYSAFDIATPAPLRVAEKVSSASIEQLVTDNYDRKKLKQLKENIYNSFPADI